MVMGRDYHREYSRKYYHRKRQEYADMLGGKCVNCGSQDGLHFDHIDRTTKVFPLGKLLSMKKSAALEEIKKCQLLCFPCHMKKSGQEISESNRLRRGGRAAEGTRLENEQAETSRGFESTPSPPLNNT
jgi:5-methylcytosine-specific restriction endonuclease McrA